METYAVRKQFRASVQGMFSYPINGTWTTGKVWDISQTGWRITGEHPLPIGHETIVFLTLRNGDALHHILIESAIVRWSDGHHAGWEILRLDALSQGSLADVMKQREPSDVPSEGMLIHA
jgi:hypothetical protein